MEESWEKVHYVDSALKKEAYGGVSFCDTAIYNVDTLCGGLFHDLGRSSGEGSTI